MIPQQFNASTSVNYNYNQLPDNFIGEVSDNLSLQKAFFEKLKVFFIGTYSQSFNNSLTLAKIFNIRITAGYTLLKRYNYNLILAKVYNEGLTKASTQY